jgi:hypothetical protein
MGKMNQASQLFLNGGLLGTICPCMKVLQCREERFNEGVHCLCGDGCT